MTMICPHCSYVRKVSDAAVPEWQCPHCQRAYAKAERGPGAGAGRAGHAGRAGWGKWLLVLAVLLGAAWSVRQLPRIPASAPASAAQAAQSQPEIVLYATSWCGYCAKTREFFRANGIAYREEDIERSTAAYNEHRRLGGQGVPLILVGEQVINGYDEAALRRALAPWL